MKVRNYRMAVMLKKLLFPNVAILYVNNVFRFCLISLMFVMVYFQFLIHNCFLTFPLAIDYFIKREIVIGDFYKKKVYFLQSMGHFTERCLIVLYGIGALIQFYILCYSIQELIEDVRFLFL